jgi:uncharacterized YigZ family protein
MTDQPLVTLAGPSCLEEEIKKSRFIAHATALASVDEVSSFLETVRQPKASHHCWAYKFDELYRWSDDGEPAGTAGKPMLGAIERLGLDRVVVVVIRYFGGVKLGASGLVRAYGGVAAACLEAAAKETRHPMVRVVIRAPFECQGQVFAVLHRFKLEPPDSDSLNYTEGGVELSLELLPGRVESLAGELAQATRGQATVTEGLTVRR